MWEDGRFIHNSIGRKHHGSARLRSLLMQQLSLSASHFLIEIQENIREQKDE
jgi:hypothetical protein